MHVLLKAILNPLYSGSKAVRFKRPCSFLKITLYLIVQTSYAVNWTFCVFDFSSCIHIRFIKRISRNVDAKNEKSNINAKREMKISPFRLLISLIRRPSVGTLISM